ncbi:unnamed protein product (macronuclear) [Paramecium tetraurelia]|uniref:Uncharacterized protein n=1 Tax=Paramecium tetraurelia TaxID=5888 RepID=A0D442_PARTE|nr:uncharacterized protein GSPATT00013274001 [Paramecium tetraurelia]CAK77809.1 unnamed protein product [Paramecium tetraurelia]|eukprot:XP_001445206.1 hypothetical protein (macronuclear) [Paramecium tetraurelia strain d4-2]
MQQRMQLWGFVILNINSLRQSINQSKRHFMIKYKTQETDILNQQQKVDQLTKDYQVQFKLLCKGLHNKPYEVNQQGDNECCTILSK